jgi:hypothetical protein
MRRTLAVLALMVPAVGLAAASLAWLPAGARSSVTAPAPVRADRQDSFPHLQHQGMFPLCAGCHAGIPEGDTATAYPEPDSCDGCHDGVDQARVDWRPEPRPVGLLDFTHPAHADEVAGHGDPPLECAACHVAEAGPRMAIVPLAPERCLDCHDGQASEAHLDAVTDCANCHRPLARAATGEALLATVPLPADHDAPDFLSAHEPVDVGDLNRCATCHVQERCASCHVDPGLDAIQRVPGAPAGWRLPEMPARYPVPASHEAALFERLHGHPPPAAADCSTCHTRDDCAACHLSPLPASALALPRRPGGSAGTTPRERQERQQVRAPGVGLEERLPGSHQSPFFVAAHATVAAAAPESCASCHTQSYCAACHDAPRAPGYHPANFATRHAAAVGSQAMECSNCHNTQAFCRQCHVEMGFGSVGRLAVGYHDAEPLWLLRHGQGARQGLEQCASCHTQKECLQCHSQAGAFKVNPHGPDFDAERARSRNAWICSACHLGAPGGGGP